MYLEFSQEILDKSSNIRFHEIRQVGAELFHADGRTDGQKDEANSSILQFCKRA